MKLNLLKEININSIKFNITWDKLSDGADFSIGNGTIRIGIKSLKQDPLFVFSILSHEIMEIIYVLLGCRFVNGRTGDNYLFNFDHQSFENSIQIYSQTINQFIKWK